MSETPIRQYRTTDNRIVRVYFDTFAPDPAKDKDLLPELQKELHELWSRGEVYVAEVFPANISLLDFEAGNDVEYMGGFYGEDGPESYFPNIENETQKEA